MALPSKSGLALKEWAVAVKALAEGKQILILRKGGIHRDDKEFRVVHPEFLLYPTYEHQSAELVKSDSQIDLEHSLLENDAPGSVKLGYWCKVTDRFEVSDQEALNSIDSYHIWTSDYANKRLRWRPKYPLTIAFLRVYGIQDMQAIPVLKEYGGCKSWVELAQRVPLGDMTPVLSDDDYEAQAEVIRRALGSEAPVA